MDCSVLLGRQLEVLEGLTRDLQRRRGDPADQVAWRELLDRASAHFQAREQIVLPALQHGGWKGLNNEALTAHVELKRALAALCICGPGEPDFGEVLRGFALALDQQALADRLWIVPSLRRTSSRAERQEMCEQIERLYAALIPPSEHYLEAMLLQHTQGSAVIEDAAVVLSSFPGAARQAQPE